MSTEEKKTVIVQKKKRRPSSRSGDAFDRKYNAAVKAYLNYMEGLNLILKEKETKMFKILRKRSSPLWFQELTDEQCSTCDQLLDAIGDDTDEHTFHRSGDLIRRLGVYPMCPKRVLRTALILCNRNDISFLWILLELHYIRRPTKEAAARQKDYTINERLLLSAIAHLDMMTTLRGLDKVLPPKKRSASPSKARRSGEMSCSKSNAGCSRSPYKNKQTMIKTGYTVPVQFQPHQDEFLGRYKKYQDPEYIIRSEESRWFTKCGGSYRNLFSCEYYMSSEDREEVCSTTSEQSGTSASAVVMALLDDHIRSMITRVECCQMLCPKHQQLDEQSEQILQILKRNTPAHDILMQAVRAQCAQLTEEELLADGKRQIESLLKRLVDEAVTMAILDPVNECPECHERFDIQQKLMKGQQCTCAASIFSDKPMPESMADQDLCYFRFQSNKPIPFEFNYDRILDAEGRKGPSCPIKCAIGRALGAEHTGTRVDVDQAIEKFAQMTWNDEMKHWKAQMTQKVKQTPPSESTDLLELECIQTKDISVLQDLLKRALRKLAEHPMYLLATFPAVEKLPILVAWIRHRYGVPVQVRERDTALLESEHFWNYLIPNATSMRWPSRKDTCLESKINWDYKTKLESMAGRLMFKFYRKFKKVQIQEGRLWWTSMVAYHSGVDRFRRTFAAYFPNCEPAMVPMVRPWRPFEYRSMPTVKGTNSRSRF